MVAFFYLVTVLVWGSSWLAVQFQLGTVDPSASVTYRFLAAAAIMVAFCLVTRRRLRFSLAWNLRAAFQGALLFSTNFYLIYQGSQYLLSGQVAVIFASVLVLNIIGTSVLFGTAIEARTVFGSLLGIGGLVAVFWPELVAFDLSRDGTRGLLLVFAGTFSAAMGMLVSAVNQRRGMPVLETNAVGMVYGAALMVLYTLAGGDRFGFEVSAGYIGSLFFLAVFASVIGFWSYLTLVGRIGADRAGYATVMFPVVALVLSTWFEDFTWTPLTVVGVALVLVGNIAILVRFGPAKAVAPGRA